MNAFVPDPLTFVGYGIYFGFGWLLYQRRDLLPSFNRDAWAYVILALVLSPINPVFPSYKISRRNRIQINRPIQARTAFYAVNRGYLPAPRGQSGF